jgi:hypothetical protein
MFFAPSSAIALEPFRYVWNNPPAFALKNIWLALLTPITVFFVISFSFAYLMTLSWQWWKSR